MKVNHGFQSCGISESVILNSSLLQLFWGASPPAFAHPETEVVRYFSLIQS